MFCRKCWRYPIKAWNVRFLSARKKVETNQKLRRENETGDAYFKEFMKLLKSQRELPFIYSSKRTNVKTITLPFVSKMGKSFNALGVNSELTHGLHMQDITEPTLVQTASLPLLLKGRKAIIESATGSGKTLAFLLPILQNIGKKPCSNIIIVPTRELASQIYKEALKYVSDQSLVSRHCSGINIEHEKKLIHALRDSKLLIGTPKKLLEIVEENIGHFRNVKCAVVDEVDKLLPFKSLHGKAQKNRLNKTKPTEKLLAVLTHFRPSMQIIATSATISWKLVQELQDLGLTKSCEVIQLNPLDYKHGKIPENISHFFSIAPEEEDNSLLKYCSRLFTHAKVSSALVFIARSKSVEMAVEEFKSMGYTASALYKELLMPAPNSFENFLQNFKNGNIQIVVATEETVRGLDFPFVKHVYLTYIPYSVESYVHVAGRAGRLGQNGVVTTIIAPSSAKSDKKKLKKYYSLVGVKGRLIQFK